MGWPFRPMASEPTILEPAAALEPSILVHSILVHWLSLYIGCVVCMIGIVVTRQAYKLSPGFQARLAATGFHQLAMDAPVADKARVMLSILQNAWPATVSEMLMDTDAAHGMIFKSLMVAGCLAALQSDFAALSPAMPLLPTATAAMSVVHLLRKLVLAFAIGFCFSPVTGRDHGVAEMPNPSPNPSTNQNVRPALALALWPSCPLAP